MGFVESDRKALLSTVDKFCREFIDPRVSRIEQTAEFPWDVYHGMAELGLFALWIPEEYGGMPCDLMTYLLVVERIARSSIACAQAYTNGKDPTKAIVRGGSEVLRSKYLPGIAAGDIIPCLALTEPGAGSDAAGITTHAVRDGNVYRISGRKQFITSGSVGHVYVVYAKTDKDAGWRGISAFVVPRDAKGFSVGKDEDLMGLRGSPTNPLVLDDVAVPTENLLGKEGEGFLIAVDTLDDARLSAAVGALALAGESLGLAVEYAKTRQQFGQPIIEFQGLQFLLAEMSTELCAAWAIFEQAVELVERAPSRHASAYVAMAKLVCTDVGMKVTTDAVQIFGGYGLSKQYPVERLMRDAKAFQIFDGTNQIQRGIVGKYLTRYGVPVGSGGPRAGVI